MALIHITKENFQAEVMESDKPVILDFYADWCGPCRMVAPVLEEIAREHPEMTVGKINVDENMELAIQFGVSSIPLLVGMQGGKILNKTLGVSTKEEILGLLR